LLGSGGMGDVYLADDAKLGRRVALKVLSRGLASDSDRRERFEREARAAAALNHPNIVTIYSVEEVDGVSFLTLELIEGQALVAMIPAGGLALDRIVDLAIPLADGVGAAHQRGITHRDLKPANVMIASDGRLKILDFGLAKIKEDLRADEPALPTAALTGEGRIVGTVNYMSPEQAEAKAVDQRSDVFSLGVILYEMATGVRPFEGDTQMSTLSSIIKDTPTPIGERRAGLPREFIKIVNRCLAKDPEDRYQSAKDLRNDLRALKNDLTSGELQSAGSGAAAAPPQMSTRRLKIAAIAGAVLIGVGAIAALLFLGSGSRTGPKSGTRPFDSIRLTRLTSSGTAGSAAISRDGRYAAYVSFADGKRSLVLRQIATTSDVELIPPDEARLYGPRFSPDGNHIYYVSSASGSLVETLYRIPILGGGSSRVLEDIATPVEFSPDGQQFAFLRRDPNTGTTAIILASVDGGSQRTLAARKRPQTYQLYGVSWSPDGKSIVATATSEEDRPQIVVLDVASGKETVSPTPDWRGVGRVSWLPDGASLLATAYEGAGEASDQVFLVSHPSGATRRLTSDLSSYSGLSVQADGKSFVAVRTERRAALWTMPLANPGNAVQIKSQASSNDGNEGLTWTPDERLVYVSDASGNPDIWIMRSDGSRRVQLTSNAGRDLSPRVTSDGRYIVFASDRDGAMRGWRMALDGSGAVRLTPDAVARWRVTPSADGKWVYYDTVANEARRVSIDGGQPMPVFSAEVLSRLNGPLPPRFHEPMPSPDGSAIAGHYQSEKGERIALIPLGGGPVKLFDAVPASGIWSPDGKALLYVDTRNGVSNVMQQPVSGGPATSVTNFTTDEVFGFAVSPDHKHLAVVRGDVTSDIVLVSDGRR
jgi:eukaryotic-like serine/threonine-protein kinase